MYKALSSATRLRRHGPDMRDEPQKVGAVDRGVTEACPAPVPVRVKAAAADLHHLAGPALLRQGAAPICLATVVGWSSASSKLLDVTCRPVSAAPG